MLLQYFRDIFHKETLSVGFFFFFEKDFKSGNLNSCLQGLLISKTMPYFHRILFFRL